MTVSGALPFINQTLRVRDCGVLLALFPQAAVTSASPTAMAAIPAVLIFTSTPPFTFLCRAFVARSPARVMVQQSCWCLHRFKPRWSCAPPGGRESSVSCATWEQLGDQLIPVTAIDRANVLDVPARLRYSGPLEQKRRRVQRDAEQCRFVFVGDGRLDGLRARCDDDLVALFQELVEGAIFEVGLRKSGHQRFRDMEHLERHRLSVGEPEPLDADHPILRRNLQPAGETGAGADHRQIEGPAGRNHAPPAHVLGERGQCKRLGDLWLGHVGATAMPSRQVPLADQLIDGGSNGQPGDTQVVAELPLRWNGVAHAEGLDQVEHPLPSYVLLSQVRSPDRSGLYLFWMKTARSNHMTDHLSIPDTKLIRCLSIPLCDGELASQGTSSGISQMR